MPENSLADYLHRSMEELHYTSERSFAAYLGVSYSTVNRLLRGDKVDPESLQKVAAGLKVPIENLYRLAGYLPPDEAQTQVLREIEGLLRKLPDADQRRILEMVRVEYKYQQQREASEPDRSQETG